MSLELTDVYVTYSRPGRIPAQVVVAANLRVEPGRIVGLVGESGSGKSSLARAAVGLVRPSHGTVLFEGKAVRTIGGRARPRALLGLQMVFQNPGGSLNPRRRVASQISDGPRSSRNGRMQPAEVVDLLRQLGLPPSAAGKYPHQLSGGQRQRVAIARALATSPSILILDEPLASLDASAQAQLANLLRTIADSAGVGMLLISHDLAVLRHIADEVAVMYLGVIMETGPAATVWDVPLHPYTEALVRAVPKADGKGELPSALGGEVGDPADPPRGCRFHPRCPYAHEKCREQEPPTVEVADHRRVACWLHHPGEVPVPPALRHPDDLGRPIAGSYARV